MSTTGTSESPVVSDEVVALDPDDEGLGNVRPNAVLHVNGAG